MRSAPPVIELSAAGVRLGSRMVLDGLSLRVDEGEMVGVIGPNGAGKTTLLRALLGLCRVCEGRIRVLGQDPSALGGARLARFRLKVGYVPQLERGAGGVPLTVREVVEISRAGHAGLLRGLGARDREAVDLWLERMGLSALADVPYACLSGGQQRKVQLARALCQEPRLLLLDEPASNLDLAWQEALVRTVERVHRTDGLALLLVTHEVSLLPASCRRVVVLQGGRLHADGPPEEVLVPEVLSQVYGTAVEVERRGGRYRVHPASALTEVGADA